MKFKSSSLVMSLIPAIMTTLSLFLLLIYLCLNFTLFSRVTMLNALERSGYYANFTQKLTEKMSEECLHYDIMPSVLDSYVNEKIVKEEMSVRIRSFYKQETMVSSARFFKFEDTVEKMLVEQTGQELDEQQKGNLLRLSIALESIWSTTMQLPVQNLTQFLLFNAKPQLQVLALAFAILLLVSTYLCFNLNRGPKSRLKISSNIVYGAGISCVLFGLLIPIFRLMGTMPKDNLLYGTYQRWTNAFVFAIIITGVIVIALMVLIKKVLTLPKPQH